MKKVYVLYVAALLSLGQRVDSLSVYAGVSVIDAPKKGQDRASVSSFVVGGKKCTLAGVYDGHGIRGELAAQTAQQTVQQEVENDLSDYEEDGSNISDALYSALSQAALVIKESDDLKPAGTTAVVACVCEDMLHLANVGDSRAVIGRCEDTIFSGEQPILDHGCDNEGEIARLRTSGAKVVVKGCFFHESFNPQLRQDWVCPNFSNECSYAKYLNNNGFLTRYTRSLDGGWYHQNNVTISDPEMSSIELCAATDRFVILASDGVWEELLCDPITNDVAVAIVGDTLDANGYTDDGAQQAAACLAQEAQSRWPSGSADDISVVVLAFNWDE